MRVGISVALVCLAIGTLWIFIPDYLKYGWRKHYPEELKSLSEKSYIRYMRRSGALLIAIGCVILLVSLII